MQFHSGAEWHQHILLVCIGIESVVKLLVLFAYLILELVVILENRYGCFLLQLHHRLIALRDHHGPIMRQIQIVRIHILLIRVHIYLILFSVTLLAYQASSSAA